MNVIDCTNPWHPSGAAARAHAMRVRSLATWMAGLRAQQLAVTRARAPGIMSPRRPEGRT